MFEKLEMAPADPILGLTEAFNNDCNPAKINLGVGVYKDETGITPVMNSVHKAEQIILDTEKSKGYLPIPGSPDYGKVVRELLFGAADAYPAATAHTPGGTGALRVAAQFLKKFYPDATVWISDPTWPNHNGIFGDAGFTVDKYTYYNAQERSLNFEGMLASIQNMAAGDIILLHACCHNPSGIDPTTEQWKQITQVVNEKKLLPLVDFAYQGLGRGLDEDAEGLRILAAAVDEMVICSSFSKNFGLYRERVGAITLKGGSKEIIDKAFSNLKTIIRRIYSNPPSHGGAIVVTIMNDAALRAEWEKEVAQIRDRIAEMRTLFVDTLKAKGAQQDFSFLTTQYGMFSFSGLNPEQVKTLKEKHSIYIVGSGRINVAGMTRANMDALCTAVAEVL
ncbi:MAG: aspartate/tyrosine/aromatic aminotransferase [Phycisphaerae bacterium]|nr:aspartate/tyrosine/aromatic aminotransferase [Phycisphaerae bacterium]